MSKLTEPVVNLLNEKGWCQQSYVNSEGQSCLIGAIIRVTQYSQQIEIEKLLLAKLGFQQDQLYSLIDWNDDPARTKEDVINLLESV